MAETYCGKTCAECGQREVLSCPGCQSGPGRQYGGDCELARCCMDKGHETCDTCGFRGSCETLRRRESIPGQRLSRREAEAARRTAAACRAPVLGKWLWVLFWLVIPSTIAGLMTNQTVAEWIPGLYWPGQLLSAACAFAYGLILLLLTGEEEGYKTAGICTLITGVVDVVVSLVSGPAQTPTWTLLLTIPAGVVSLVGVYNEYMAHSSVLADVDDGLSEKWYGLWRWYLGTIIGLFGGVLVMLLVPILGLIIVLAAAVSAIVVSVVKLVYLYRTAKSFRAYSPAA